MGSAIAIIDLSQVGPGRPIALACRDADNLLFLVYMNEFAFEFVLVRMVGLLTSYMLTQISGVKRPDALSRR